MKHYEDNPYHPKHGVITADAPDPEPEPVDPPRPTDPPEGPGGD